MESDWGLWDCTKVQVLLNIQVPLSCTWIFKYFLIFGQFSAIVSWNSFIVLCLSLLLLELLQLKHLPFWWCPINPVKFIHSLFFFLLWLRISKCVFGLTHSFFYMVSSDVNALYCIFHLFHCIFHLQNMFDFCLQFQSLRFLLLVIYCFFLISFNCVFVCFLKFIELL